MKCKQVIRTNQTPSRVFLSSDAVGGARSQFVGHQVQGKFIQFLQKGGGQNGRIQR